MKNRNVSECPEPTGILVIIGGAEAKESGNKPNLSHDVSMPVLQSFIELLPSENARIEVITTAGSQDPDDTYRAYQNSFTKCGASYVGHIHHNTRNEIDYAALEQRLKDANAIFFSGGDQLKITSVYGGTEFIKLLKQRYVYEKLVLGGTSAGAMALSTPMIYGGVGRDEMIAGNVKVTTGLEFLRDVCVDTHFVNRGRFVRMAQVLAENPASIGIGIEEDTAIVVRNGMDIQVIGTGVIIIIDASNNQGTNITQFDGSKPLSLKGLCVDILSAGDKYTIKELNPPHQ